MKKALTTFEAINAEVISAGGLLSLRIVREMLGLKCSIPTLWRAVQEVRAARAFASEALRAPGGIDKMTIREAVLVFEMGSLPRIVKEQPPDDACKDA